MTKNIYSFKTTDLSFLKNYSNTKKREFLKYINNQENKDSLFQKMMPQLFFYISIDLLFPYIYKIPELEKTIIDYMDKHIIQTQNLSPYFISLLIDHTDCGKKYFFEHLPSFFQSTSNQLDKMVELIYLYNKNPDFQLELIRAFLTISHSTQIPILLRKGLFLDSIDSLFTEIAKIKIDPNLKKEISNCILGLESLLNDIIIYIENKPDFLFQIPVICDKILELDESNHLPTHLYPCKEEAIISNYIEMHYDLLFQKATPENKLKLLEHFPIPKNSSQKEFYQRLLTFLSHVESKNTFFLLHCASHIFQPDYISIIENLIQQFASSSPKYLNHGAFALVLDLGNYVLKIGNQKGQENFTPISFFRLIPEIYYQAFYKVQQKYDFVLEIQPKINTQQVNKIMTTDAWFQLFWDFYIHHLEIADNTIIDHSTNNLGILDSWKQASNPNEKLPNYFKQMPIVILDQDFIFKRGETKGTYNQSYTKAMYEFLIEYLRNHEIPEYVQQSNEWNEKTKTLKYFGK